MKTFIASCILLAVLAGGVLLNTCVLTSRTDKLQEQAAALPNTATEERTAVAANLRRTWEADKMLFILSVRQENIEKVEDALARLETAAKRESGSNFYMAAAELTEALKRIREVVGLNIEGIF